jgi:hypothetical protein
MLIKSDWPYKLGLLIATVKVKRGIHKKKTRLKSIIIINEMRKEPFECFGSMIHWVEGDSSI